MSQRQIALPGAGLGRIGVAATFDRLFKILWIWRFRAVSRRQLASMDHHLMSDIGLDPSEAVRESIKPFWQA